MEQTKIIFVSTIIILVVTLSLVGYILSITQKKYVYPPHLNECPDYYELNSFGECYDKYELFHTQGNKCYSENFNELNYKIAGTSEYSGLCNKKQWSIDCDVPWDGITNNKDLCI
jgi:hypothetical protein